MFKRLDRIKKQEKGITLIALIITIIVILILAGVSINSLVGKNGIVGQARKAVEAHKKAAFKEQVELDIAAVITELYAKKQPVNLQSVLAILVDTQREYKYTLRHIKNINESEETPISNVENINIDGDNKTEYVKITKDGEEAKVYNDYTIEVEEREGEYAIPQQKPPIEIPPFVGGGYNETKGVNTPKIVDGLIPITINEDGTPNIVENPDTDSSWYKYTSSEKMWANAITTEDGTKTVKVTGYWVWIPRYAYQITSQYHIGGTGGGNINIKFLKNKTNEATDGTISWDNVSGLNKWNVHPAFCDDVTIGGWDENLEGIWVAKFPAGYAEGNNDVAKVSSGINYSGQVANNNFYGSIDNNTPMYYPVFLPETYAYNNINIGDSFNLAKNLGKSSNIYGLTANANSHQMKNSEWGAVAYLTQSAYGLNDKMYINNANLNNSPETIHAITGWV